MTRNAIRRGFSLIELVIVIVIIGIIGAIAIPRMSRGSAGAADSALTANLAILRNGIEMYTQEHQGVRPTVAGFVAELTTYTNLAGTTSATQTGRVHLRALHPHDPEPPRRHQQGQLDGRGRLRGERRLGLHGVHRRDQSRRRRGGSRRVGPSVFGVLNVRKVPAAFPAVRCRPCRTQPPAAWCESIGGGRSA